MKTIGLLFLAMLCMQSVTSMRISQVALSPHDIGEALEGILTGLVEGDIKIKECIQDTKEIEKDFEAAIASMKHGHTLDDISKAFKAMGAALEKVPEAIKDCNIVKEVLADIKTFAILFTNPIHFLEKTATNILWHGKEIYHEMKSAISSYEEGDYFEFGEFIGKLIKTATKMRLEPIDAAHFLKGFIEEATTPVGDINECIEKSQKVQDLVVDLAKQFEHFGIKSMEGAIKDIQEILAMIPVEFKQCEVISEQALHVFAHWAKDFSDIKTMSTKIVSALWTHHAELVKIVKGF